MTNAVHPWSVHCECAIKHNKRRIFNDLHIRDMFFPGVKDGVLSQDSATDSDGDGEGHIGVKDYLPFDEFPMEGHVDEFKYYYRVLNPTGKITEDY